MAGRIRLEQHAPLWMSGSDTTAARGHVPARWLRDRVEALGERGALVKDFDAGVSWTGLRGAGANSVQPGATLWR